MPCPQEYRVSVSFCLLSIFSLPVGREVNAYTARWRIKPMASVNSKQPCGSINPNTFKASIRRRRCFRSQQPLNAIASKGNWQGILVPVVNLAYAMIHSEKFLFCLPLFFMSKFPIFIIPSPEKVNLVFNFFPPSPRAQQKVKPPTSAFTVLVHVILSNHVRLADNESWTHPNTTDQAWELFHLQCNARIQVWMLICALRTHSKSLWGINLTPRRRLGVFKGRWPPGTFWVPCVGPGRTPRLLKRTPTPLISQCHLPMAFPNGMWWQWRSFYEIDGRPLFFCWG